MTTEAAPAKERRQKQPTPVPVEVSSSSLEQIKSLIQQTIKEQLQNIEVAASNGRKKQTPVLKFSVDDRKQIMNLILNEARNNATKWDEDSQSRKFNDYAYQQAIPTDEEFDRFIFVCEQKALDPRANQIYFQKRAGRAVFLVAIDSYRLQAERSGRYRPSQKATEYYDNNHRPYYGPEPHHCVVFCWKQDDDGTWFEMSQIAFFDEYKQTYKSGKLNDMWSKMGRSQLEKCFSSDTEVLTDLGFELFSHAKGNVLEVTDAGLRSTDARPWSRPWDGPMVEFDSDDINFSVTPNHDMLTQFGKIQADDLLREQGWKKRFLIPRTLLHSGPSLPVSDEQLKLAGAFMADGSYYTDLKFKIEVSRSYKVQALRDLKLADLVAPVHSSGATVVATGGRIITTKSDKTRFVFLNEHIELLVDPASKTPLTKNWLNLTGPQARILLDSWQNFDGNGRRSNVRRFFSSRDEHTAAYELLAVLAGYSVSPRSSRCSDISSRPGTVLGISERTLLPVYRREFKRSDARNSKDLVSLRQVPGTGIVWCVTVPSGVIVVRRHGFSMLCGNCGESKLLRKGWPAELGGIYTKEEMEQSSPQVDDPTAKSSVHQDLAAARQGAENAGHGKRDSQKRQPANPEPAQAKPVDDPKADPNTHMCVECSPQHPRAKHDGENGYGACMVDNCHCQGFSDTLPMPIMGSYEIPAAEGRKARTMYECQGRVIEFKNQDSKGNVLKTAKGTQFVQLKIYGLVDDLGQDPNAVFYCYHRNTLFDCLALSLGENIHFIYSKTVTPATEEEGVKGKKGYKPAKPRVIWQNIEDVTRIGQRKFHEGKPIAEEPPAESVEDAAKRYQERYERIVRSHNLDPAAKFEGKPRYILNDVDAVIDVSTGELYETKSSSPTGLFP